MNEMTRENALYDEEANMGFVELVLSCDSDQAKSELEDGLLDD